MLLKLRVVVFKIDELASMRERETERDRERQEERER
jgi:hypothetical protein